VTHSRHFVLLKKYLNSRLYANTSNGGQGGGGMWIPNPGWEGGLAEGGKKKATLPFLMAEAVSDMPVRTLDGSARVQDVS